MVRKTDATGYRSPNALLRTMLCRFRRPAWATKVIVLADAEFSSKETLTLIKKRGYFFVMSLPRTWKFTDDRALSDLVTHLSIYHYQQLNDSREECPLAAS
jgi:transposase